MARNRRVDVPSFRFENYGKIIFWSCIYCKNSEKEANLNPDRSFAPLFIGCSLDLGTIPYMVSVVMLVAMIHIFRTTITQDTASQHDGTTQCSRDWRRNNGSHCCQ